MEDSFVELLHVSLLQVSLKTMWPWAEQLLLLFVSGFNYNSHLKDCEQSEKTSNEKTLKNLSSAPPGHALSLAILLFSSSKWHNEWAEPGGYWVLYRRSNQHESFQRLKNI